MRNTNMSLNKSLKIRSYHFTGLLTFYYVFILNAALIFHAYLFIRQQESFVAALGLLLVFIVFICLLAWCLLSLCSIRWIEKPFFIILTNLSAILAYFYVYYGVIFYDNSPIVRAILQTDLHEMKEFLKPSLLVWVLFFGVLPSYLIYQIDIVRGHRKIEWIWKLLGVMCYPLFYIVTLLPTNPIFQPMLVLSGITAKPPYQIIPTNFFENVAKHLISSTHFHVPYRIIGSDATQQKKIPSLKPDLLVLVIGEAARSQNFSLNGYSRITNPYTTKQEIISFKNVSSCSTLTWVSVPCLFSGEGRGKFIPMMSNYQDNLLDIIKRVGISTFWIDNNGAGDCQGVCERIRHIILHDLDGMVAETFKHSISQLSHQDAVVVLHLHGSHGPDYFEKYPVAFSFFKPECRKNEFRLCSQQTLLNAYDNSILYSDYVLNNVIETLKQFSTHWNTALIYTSDHGESIGEGNRYGHGMPYFMAPKTQTQVPFFIWMSDGFRDEKKLNVQCLENKANHESISHDYFFHSVLGVLNIKTSIYQPKLDLFKSCQTPLYKQQLSLRKS